MFEPDEVGFLGDTIRGHLDGALPDDRWFLAETQGPLTGAAYVAPEPFGHLVGTSTSSQPSPRATGEESVHC